MLVTHGMMSNNEKENYMQKSEDKINNMSKTEIKVIGITGEAGSGKTTITKEYARLKKGYYILTDDVAKEVMEPDEDCYKKIVAYFGKDILQIDNTINREKLAKIVFNNEQELKVLNSLVHNEVVTKVIDIIENIKSLNNINNCGNIYEVVLIESAILFQVQDLVNLCDEIWYVETTEEERKARLKRERNYSDERIEAMSISQESVRLTKDKCNRIIINDRDIEELNEFLLTL